MVENSVAAVLTIGLMSFIIKENPFHKLCEYTFLAVATAYSFVLAISRINPVIITPLKNGEFNIIIPMLVGLLIYARYLKGKQWLMRFPISITIGVGLGLSLKGVVSSLLVKQVQSTYRNINTVSGFIIFIGVICVLLFFFFVRDKTGKTPIALKTTNKISQIILMLAFGCLFSNVIISRMTFLLGRIKFLLGDWLGLL